MYHKDISDEVTILYAYEFSQEIANTLMDTSFPESNFCSREIHLQHRCVGQQRRESDRQSNHHLSPGADEFESV